MLMYVTKTMFSLVYIVVVVIIIIMLYKGTKERDIDIFLIFKLVT